jgi:hypothetical protein
LLSKAIGGYITQATEKTFAFVLIISYTNLIKRVVVNFGYDQSTACLPISSQSSECEPRLVTIVAVERRLERKRLQKDAKKVEKQRRISGLRRHLIPEAISYESKKAVLKLVLRSR